MVLLESECIFCTIGDSLLFNWRTGEAEKFTLGTIHSESKYVISFSRNKKGCDKKRYLTTAIEENHPTY